jgi:hypothetical protein
MRNGAIASLLVVAILVGAGVGFFTGTSTQHTTTLLSTTALTTTLTAASSQSASTYCTQSGPQSSLYVQVVTDNANRPVVGDRVTVTVLNGCNSEQQVSLGYTNSTGYTSTAAEWVGVLLVKVTNVFSGTSDLFIAQTPTSDSVILATLSLPSGVTVIRQIACYGFCAPAGNTTTTETAATL